MVASLHPLTILCLFIIFITCSSQSNSPQNIQVFYPNSRPPPVIPPPPSPANDPPTFPPPTTPNSPPTRSSSHAAVGRAIGVTAASTLVISGILFFLLLRHSKRKRDHRENSTTTTNGGNNAAVAPQDDNFTRFNGNIKGMIVDENGLDVLYWRNLEEGDNINRTIFKKQDYINLKDEKIVVSERSRRDEPPLQEVPLLRGKSSSSQSTTWVDKKDHLIKNTPTISQDSSTQLTKTSTPPLPPPPGAPPRPPLLVSQAVPKEKTPPPPPISSNKGPAPPPPPPPGAGASAPAPAPPMKSPKARSSSLGEGTSNKGNEQVKLKPLHWDKMSPNVKHSMVWDNIEKGSFKFDGDMMEALFGTVATNRKSPTRATRFENPKSGPPSQISILDTRKSQNIAIVVKSLGVTRKEIIDALIDGHGLNADTIEKLTRIAPTDEETSQILAFNGNPTQLADAESFLYHVLKAVPTAFTRFNAMLFRSNYDLEVSHLKESLQYLESACNELRNRGLFLKLLEAVLKAGNRLNAGTSRGNAQAFNLTALKKLSDVKSSDGKTTLLQFVVQEVVRAEGKRCVLNKNKSMNRTNSVSGNQNSENSISKDDREKEYMMLGLPAVGGLSAEFSNVKRAALLDYDILVKTSSALATQMVEIRKILTQCGEEGGFAREMRGFLDTGELEIQVLKEEQSRVMEIVKKTTDYYQAGSLKDNKGGNGNSLHLFVIVRDFLTMVDQVCIDIARNVQKKKPHVSSAGAPGSSSSAVAAPGSPARVFRFPKLPPNFMSDASKSSDSDSE
ncbi:hypothetical protein RD792_012779 [Penstemon davidsonii]|uniref:Formin-like protein n=1 Tax=Penstemon davidsonii TaxID=160366 RepID=A0ABR0CZV2_9LAMI|nr:hypothetical protein RD792_012779 [Penstemon davidsonii]